MSIPEEQHNSFVWFFPFRNSHFKPQSKTKLPAKGSKEGGWNWFFSSVCHTNGQKVFCPTSRTSKEGLCRLPQRHCQSRTKVQWSYRWAPAYTAFLKRLKRACPCCAAFDWSLQVKIQLFVPEYGQESIWSSTVFTNRLPQYPQTETWSFIKLYNLSGRIVMNTNLAPP